MGADLFVSLHHNAGGKTSNYPSVWYHGSVDDNEPDMDVARHIAQALGREMRTQVAKTSPIFSSQLMYDSGFGVLRACNVPAVLCESSFFSDPAEAERLRDPVYNLREAYAIYSGLCEWAYCGRPSQTTPTVARQGQGQGGWRMLTTLTEGLPAWWGSDRSRILRSSIMVTLDGGERPVRFDELTRELIVELASGELSGTHELVIHHQNMLKNSNWPQRYQLRAQGERLSVEQLGARRPRRQPATRPVVKP
jgi:N-acetylmuramoyl-L-alanine amidase